MGNNKYKVLIVEDDQSILGFVQTILETNGYQVLTAERCRQGLLIFSSYTPDLVVLDLGLPDMDGGEFIRQVRLFSTVPIIVLSARTEENDKVSALDLGANDYITKPFNPVILAAKAKALIRRSRGLPLEEVITAGPFSYNSGTLRFYKNGDEIVLSSKENAMMKLFMDNVDRIFSRSRLYDLIWGGNIVDENTVMVYISRLRAKIEDDPSHPHYIQTVRGLGYRFVAP